MQEKSSFFIIDRYRKMSYIAGYIPVEYEPEGILEDMKKADIGEDLTEDEIKRFIDEKKKVSSDIILKKIREGYTIFEIMKWCILSPDCLIPICNLPCNGPGAEDAAYSYFNYEVKRILESELIKIVRQFRKNQGPDYMIDYLMKELENENYIRAFRDSGLEINDEKLKSIITEQERSSTYKIVDHALASWSAPGIMEECEKDPEVVFGHAELLSIVQETIRRERFRVVGKYVIKMKNSEITALIGAAEKMRFLKIIRSDTGIDDLSKSGMENYTSEYMKHISAMDQDELSDLIETLRAYVNWRGTLNFLPSFDNAPSKDELADQIINGFAENNGIKGELFRTFVVSED